MMEKSARNVFSRFNIQKMDVKIDDQADFNKHEVVFVTPVPGKKDDQIIFIQEQGYLIKDRVLRAAKVGVVKNN